MSIQRNLRDGNIKDQQRRRRRAEKSPATNNAAIGRDGLLVYDGGVITIENGGLDVTGTATISGVLNVSGQTTLSGVTTITGPTGITGPLTVQGTMDVTGETTIGGNFEIVAGGLFKAGESVINPDGSAKFGLFEIAANGDLKSKGALSIEGKTTLKNDLDVTTGGKIAAGNVTIDPSVLSGALTFKNGTRLAQTPNGAQFEMAGGGAVTVSPGQADMGVIGGGAVFATSAAARIQAGGSYMEVTSGGAINMAGLSTTSNPPNLHINAAGRIYKSTWTP